MSKHHVHSAAVIAAFAATIGGPLTAAAAGRSTPTPPTCATTPDSSTPPGSAPVIDPGDGGDYRPELDSAETVSEIDNPYYPLAVGSSWRYEGESDGELEVIEVVVIDERRTVMGIEAVVVRDTVTVDGELVEDTHDWYTQDADGNVWYLGEETTEYAEDGTTSTAGSWEAGVGGALPGIVMPAVPEVDDVYRQEYCAGEAEDMMQVIGLDGAVTGPAGDFTEVVTTRDWTPLEPDVVEQKDYAPGIGMIRETVVAGGEGVVELVEFTPAG